MLTSSEQQLLSRVSHPSVPDHRTFRQLMWPQLPVRHDMLHRHFIGNQEIADQPPMAPPEKALRTHDRGRSSAGELDQSVDSIPENFRQHVIRVIAKALVVETRVRRKRAVLVLLVPTTTKNLHPNIFDV